MTEEYEIPVIHEVANMFGFYALTYARIGEVEHKGVKTIGITNPYEIGWMIAQHLQQFSHPRELVLRYLSGEQAGANNIVKGDVA